MSSKVKGDLFGESDILVSTQYTLNSAPRVLPIVCVTSYLGERAPGWMGLAALGAAVDKERRIGWAKVDVVALTSHAVSMALKRIVRRPRPHDRRIAVGASMSSRLSFSSSHVTSMTAALTGITELGYLAAPAVGVPAIMLSRLVLGVRYPIDVTLGAVLGTAITLMVNKIGDKVTEPEKAQHNQGGQSSVAERNAL